MKRPRRDDDVTYGGGYWWFKRDITPDEEVVLTFLTKIHLEWLRKRLVTKDGKVVR